MEIKTHYPLIRTIYLYIFTLLGLVLLTMGSVRFLDMGLKAFIFKKAEEEERVMQKQVPFPPINLSEIAKESNGKLEKKEEITLSAQEKEMLDRWIEDYNQWQEERSKVDPVVARRHREASNNLALILIGLPLYLYHWSIIKKETRNKN